MYASVVIARGTDRVDTVYSVQEPEYGAWPEPLYLVYDDGNGAAPEAERLHDEGHYDTVQTDNSGTLQQIADAGMTAFGALYSGNMEAWFNSNPNDPRVRIWANWDEPDSGPGENGAVKLLKCMYDLRAEGQDAEANRPERDAGGYLR